MGDIFFVEAHMSTIVNMLILLNMHTNCLWKKMN